MAYWIYKAQDKRDIPGGEQFLITFVDWTLGHNEPIEAHNTDDISEALRIAAELRDKYRPGELAERIAAAYVSEVVATLNPSELGKVRAALASEHDFYDANESRISAFRKALGRDPYFLTDPVPGTVRAQIDMTLSNDADRIAFRTLRGCK